MRPVDILIAARAKIADPKHWIQKVMARLSDGTATSAFDPCATCWCSAGVIGSLTAGDSSTQYQAIRLLSHAMGDNLVEFNDSHTHAEVLAAFDKAIHENS